MGIGADTGLDWRYGGGMNPNLPFLITGLIHRLRDFPDEAFNDLFQAMDDIERKYDLLRPLSEEDRQTIEASLADADAGRFVPHEEVEAFFQKALKGYDAETDGRDAFHEAAALIGKVPGEQQGEIANLLFVLLDTPRYDIPPPPDNQRIRPKR